MGVNANDNHPLTNGTYDEQGPKSFKVACKTKSCTEWSYNGLRFKTVADAEKYGRDLYSRWTALDKWEVHPSDDSPNQ